MSTEAPKTVFELKTKQNIDAVVAEGKAGKGVLAPVFSSRLSAAIQSAKDTNDLQRVSDPSIPALTEESLRKLTLKKMDEIGTTLGNDLEKASKGEKADFGAMAGAASAGAGLLAGGLSLLNPIAAFGAIQNLWNNSVINKWIQAAINLKGPDSMVSDDVKQHRPKNFGEAMEQINLSSGMKTFSQQLGVDGDQLTAELNRDPAARTPVAPPKIIGPEEPKPVVAPIEKSVKTEKETPAAAETPDLAEIQKQAQAAAVLAINATATLVPGMPFIQMDPNFTAANGSAPAGVPNTGNAKAVATTDKGATPTP